MERDGTTAKLRREARRLLDDAKRETDHEARGAMLRKALELAAKAERMAYEKTPSRF
jgi:hypothetical protein